MQIVSRRSPTATTRTTVSTACALLAIMVAADVPTSTSMLAAALVTAQSWSGRRVAARLFAPADVGLGVGFAVGALATVVAHVLLRQTPIGPHAWLLPIVAGMAVRPRGDAAQSAPLRDQLLVAGLSLVALSSEWFWALPPGAVIVAWWLTADSGPRRARDVAAALAALGVGAWMVARRPDVWWIFSADTHYYEALSRSIARDGIGDNSLAAGFSIAYHWFSFGWVGIVGDVVGAPQWVALTRIGPVAAVWFTMATLLEIARHETSRRRVGLGLAAFAASSAFGDWSLPVMLSMSSAFSQLFVGVWLAAFLWLVVRTAEGRVRRPALAYAVLTGALVGGKATHAAICAAGVAAAAVVDCAARRSLRSRWWVPALATSATFVVASRLLIGSSNDITLAPGRWVLYVSTEFEQFGASIRLGIAAVLVVGMCAFPLLPWILRPGPRERTVSAFLSGAVLAAIGVTLFVVDVSVSDPRGINPNGIYFLHAATTLVAAWWAVTTSPDRGRVGASFAVGAVGVGAVAALVPYAVPDPDSGSLAAIALRLARSPAPLVVILLAAAVRRIRRRSDGRRWIAIAVAASSVTFFAANWAVTMPRDQRDMRKEGESRLGAEALRDAATWLRTHAEADDLFASNYFVEGPRATDLEWIHSSDDWEARTPSLAFRSGNFPLLVVWSDRRALLQAPALVGAYQRFDGDRDAEIARRLSLSVAFADRPDASLADALREYGVAWFVVDLRLTTTRDWSPYAIARHVNRDFAVLELARDEPTDAG